MKRILSLITVVVLISPVFSSCKQMGDLFGGKKVDEQKTMEEIAAKAAGMLAEQQKKAAEEKARLDQQIETEVQKRLAEEKAKAAETQPLVPPTTDQQKTIEKVIIVKEKTAEEAKETKASGYVRIYVDKGLGGASMTVPFGRDMSTTNGTAFKDNCSSASYNIPAGWQVAIYAGSGYSEKRVTLSGSGTANDLGQVNDKCSSVRWEKR